MLYFPLILDTTNFTSKSILPLPINIINVLIIRNILCKLLSVFSDIFNLTFKRERVNIAKANKIRKYYIYFLNLNEFNFGSD